MVLRQLREVEILKSPAVRQNFCAIVCSETNCCPENEACDACHKWFAYRSLGSPRCWQTPSRPYARALSRTGGMLTHASTKSEMLLLCIVIVHRISC